jgi:hypothetical protein
VPAFVSEWRAGSHGNPELIQRVVAVRLKAEFESIRDNDREPPLYAGELVDLTSVGFVAGQLESLCQSVSNSVGRDQTCKAHAEYLSSYLGQENPDAGSKTGRNGAQP